MEKLEKETPFSEKDSTHSDLHEKDGILADLAVPDDILEAAEYARHHVRRGIEDTINLIVNEHGDDRCNFPTAVLATARRYLFDEDLKQNAAEYQHVYDELKVEAAMIKLTLPSRGHLPRMGDWNDFRWAGGFINQFFSIRFPGITVGSNVAQCSLIRRQTPRVPPDDAVHNIRATWSFNPGPFNPKEHMIITTPYTNNIIWVQYLPLYFNQSWATGDIFPLLGYQILVALSTNFIGYGLAGLTRRFLVYPASAIWYNNLSIIALNRAFHAEKETVANGWRLSRMRWFVYCFSAMFVYFWFPTLSYFNWMTWIAPDNISLAAITGSVSGLGLNPIPTFDWNQLVYAVDPLIYPFFVSRV
ncbi:OPT oligopeptide transporter protein-domain-containing protein [Mycena leptocephala]|nr:OPT oligopeptide transporter protein-domain-containing protein [Mycena leptocephala]